VIEQVNLVDICKPKQWKTIAASKLKDDGFPVYGANGKIGFYSEYTHECPTVLITCRGATCGTVNICEPKSYVNGNAMALDNLSASVDLKYLYYVLDHRGFNDVISGSAQPQITRTNLKNLKIPLPPLAEQKKIAAILDAADVLRQKDAQLIDKYNALSQSLFLDMFGDPVTNPMGWERQLLLLNTRKITKGGSPKWQGFDYVDKGVRFITSENVLTNKLSLVKEKFIPHEFNLKLKNSQLEVGDVLINIVGASAGRAAIVSGKCLPANINQAVAKISLSKSSCINGSYLVHLLNEPHFNKFLLGEAVDAARLNLSLSNLKNLNIICPPISLQNQFAEHIQAIEAQKQQAQASLQKSEELFNSLLQRAFKGELTA